MRRLTEEERNMGALARNILYAQLPSRALLVLIQLGVPDMLSQQPLSLDILAERTNSDRSSLGRLLRSLTVYGVLKEDTQQVFSLGPVGEAMTTTHPASALPSARLLAGAFGDAWLDLLSTVRTGQSPFVRNGEIDLFTYMDHDHELRATFDESQGCGLALELDEILDNVDFSEYPLIVDVGGGGGTFLRSILAATPGVTGIVFDLPTSIAQQPATTHFKELSSRYCAVAGNFFESVPSGGDLYILSHILHDWDDLHAVRILRTCRRAMGRDSTLMIVDLAGLETGHFDERLHNAAIMDLYMLSLFGGSGGQERSVNQVKALLHTAGFHLTDATILPSGMSVIQASPAKKQQNESFSSGLVVEIEDD